MSNSIHHLIGQFNLQTHLFNNVVHEVTDDMASQQLNQHTNHMAWLIGHTVSTRFMMVNLLGVDIQEPFPELFENGKGRDDNLAYPNVSDLTKDWNTISKKMISLLNNLDEASLMGKMPNAVPTGNTLGDFIAFIAHHEAYTIGQLGISRRFHGLEAMKYS